MTNRKLRLNTLSEIVNILTLIGSAFILVSLSYDIIFVGDYYLSPGFLEMQFIVCMVFTADFFLRLALSSNRRKFVANNIILLIVSIPVLNIMQLLDIQLPMSTYVIFKSAPLLRGFYGMVVIMRWLTRSRIRSLMLSYLLTVICFTYFASLLFYTFEHHRNPMVYNFGDAMVWAWMNVTTVGANIFAVTALGKVLSVVLAALGMMMFPIFTAYVIDKFKRDHNAKEVQYINDNAAPPAIH